MASDLNTQLSKDAGLFGLKVWEVIGIIVGLLIVLILFLLTFYLTTRKKLRRAQEKLPLSQIPSISKEIKEVRVEHVSADNFAPRDGILLTIHDKSSDKESDKVLVHVPMPKVKNGDNSSQSGSFHHIDKDYNYCGSEEGSSGTFNKPSSSQHPITAPSPLSGLPEFSHLGWGHWFTLRDLELATNRFSKEYVIGEGGYGVVYRGQLINGTPVAVKKLLNNLGQAEKEFRVEVEAIGHVRHKNLVRLLGYCIEGTHRMLVYEYVNNGNLEQYVAPEYANTGLLNEKSDVYSFGVLLLEAITGRDPVDYGRPAPEVNLVDWLKMMVGSRRSEEVVDPNIDTRPSTRALKRALLTALRCVDPDSDKRPRMTQVVRMLESEEYPIPREDRRHRRTRASSIEIDVQRENYDTDKSDGQDLRSESIRNS
ncbi:probable receptor-like protein kinase at5g18500 [Phtheirospermum japonicum]|uniref:non-specific serine/threonine protein kinase n=1 Tax=Phtheirospermum japonicum TaxID=374723 RepID=A0A830BSQ7_9LAMI|nr:probable receptor-like protein kinase at5g18500 [Phtheirospermum japonicum]